MKTVGPARVHHLNFHRRNTVLKYEYYLDGRSQWRWRALSSNDQIIAESGESYLQLANCLHAIDLMNDSENAPCQAAFNALAEYDDTHASRSNVSFGRLALLPEAERQTHRARLFSYNAS